MDDLQRETVSETKNQINNFPIIGILAQEISYQLNQIYPDRYKSFIAASYVKFVEAGGARVVPIWTNKPLEYYEEIMKNINGVLLPGGSTWFHVPYGYADAGSYIYKIAKDMNEKGDYFPLWGTCLGFELLSYVDADCKEHRKEFTLHNNAEPVKFVEGFEKSKLFKNAPKNIVEYLEKESDPVTNNFHRYFINEECLRSAGVEENWKIISTNTWENQTYISMFEHKRYPFYGVQFHPEKNMYEWRSPNYTHSEASMIVSQYFSQFFVQECRKNQHKFRSNLNEEQEYLIYNFPITYTGLKGAIYEQCYLFTEDSDYPAKEYRKILAMALIIHGIFCLKFLVNR